MIVNRICDDQKLNDQVCEENYHKALRIVRSWRMPQTVRCYSEWDENSIFYTINDTLIDKFSELNMKNPRVPMRREYIQIMPIDL